MTVDTFNFALAGYRPLAQIYRGQRTSVYRALSIGEQPQPIVIKFLTSEYPTERELLQFRHQYTILQGRGSANAKQLDLPGVIRPYQLLEYRRGYALVMEDFGGMSLSEYQSSQLLSLTDVLAIAIQLADILHGLHQQRIVHKDIKPANILIHPKSQQVKLIDFGIASLLPKETQGIQNPQGLEGTIAYIAPEQTGRMNRGSDYRADYYALGVTLYQLLSGTLPFTATEPMELIHCHIAKEPIPVNQINQNIPDMVAEIVGKLMAKNAEDRYQSALGLKFDLEKCLTQWQVTGAIAEFEVGVRDLSDRLLIPEKLYGRGAEVQTLLESFERVAQGSTEMLLIAGFSGIGKTAVVNEIHKPIVRQRGYFIKGKFDQFNRNIPLSAFVQSLRGLMGQLLAESDLQLAQWQIQILAAVGEHGQVLIEVIPELEQIIGKQPPAPELSGSAAQNRFNLLFQKFIQVFTTASHPLVIFLDDLQWADLASIELMKLLMTGNGYLSILGAYRDNEVFPAHPLMMLVAELQQAQIVVNTLKLAPLALTDTNQLVADTLNCPPALAQPLTELIDRKTKGNPFFTTQFLKSLHEDGYIYFNPDRRYWECDIAQVQNLTLTDDVVEFMAQQLQKLPSTTQIIMQLAACIGNQFDLTTLAIVSEQSTTEAAAALWQALQEGLILPTSQVYKFFQEPEPFHHDSFTANATYRFLHDRVQQAAYSLIPEAHRANIHYRIGRLLLNHFSPTTQAERIFEIVGHLNPGSESIVNDAERIDLAQWNLMAGSKAISSNAYSAALAYLNQAINLLPEDTWTSHYALTLELHHHRLDVAYLNNQFDDLESWGEIVLQQATSLLDRIKVYETRIMALRSQGRFLEVVDTGLQILKLLGIEFPAQPTTDDVNAAFDRSRQDWQGHVLLSLMDLPSMEDPRLIAAMQIMSKIVPSAHIAAPLLLPLLSFKQVELSIQFGNSPISIFSYADYGLILCGIIGDIATGYEFGQLALALLDKLQITAFKSRTYFIVNSFTRHWVEPLNRIVPLFLDGYRSGLESGDWECVALNLVTYSHYQYWAGRELKGLAEEMVTYREVIAQVKQVATLKSHEIYLQTILNLLGQAEVPDRLEGEFFDPDRSLPQFQSSNNRVALFNLNLNQAFLYYLFDRNEQATLYASELERYSDAICGFFYMTIWVFYDALIQLRCYPSATPDRQVLMLERVAVHQAKLQVWATDAPFNHQHRCQLIAAEQARVLHQVAAAIDLYDLAIAGAKANGFIQDEALANELAAKFYLDWGKAKIAQEYLTNAYSSYDRWGAKAKVRDLERRYPQLLAPMLQQQQMVLSAQETANDPRSQAAGKQSTSSSSDSIAETLDLTTAIEAAQTLSIEIQLDKLLATLLHTLLENAGADKGVLLMPQEHQWFLEAVATIDRPAQVQSTPVESSLEVPHSLINIVKRSREAVVIGDASVHPTLGSDVYVWQQQPKSLLCTPILLQGKLVAILYLENQLTIGAFTSDRLKVLNLLCAQAAIALENARLFNAEQEKSQALKVSIEQLQQSELRFQSLFEKSSDAIMLLDENGFIDCNEAAVKLFGYSHKSQLYHLHPAALSPTIQPGGQPSEGQCDVHFAKALAAGSYRFEWLHQRRDGETFWAEIVLTPIVLNHKQVGHAIVRDISDRKSAESKLKFTQFAVDNSAEGVTWLRSDGSFAYGNQAICQMLGYTRAELCQLHIWDIDDSPLITPSTWPDHWQQLKAMGRLNLESEHHSKDGKYYPVELSLHYFQFEGEEYNFAQVRDITDRKQAELNLRSTNQELMRATRLKDEFLANMSHELRTPLNAILGLSESLQEQVQGPINPHQHKALATIERSGQHLLALINDILEVSKIEAGKLELDLSSVNVASLCNSSLAFVKQQAFTKQIQLTTNIAPHLGKTQADERRLRQVLINLLTNAVKFTPAGGRVTLDVRLENSTADLTESTDVSAGQEIEVGDPWLVLAISDTGIGIAAADMTKLFQPFVQIDSSLNRQYEGTGLGLTLVKQIVELHGGSVSVDSRVGQGSCFTVRLPYYLCPVETTIVAAPVDSSSLALSQSVTTTAQYPLILLAEDNQDNIDTLSVYLECQDYRLLIARNGQEAIELTQAHQPDLILMDIQMPGVDGLSAIKTIREDLHLTELPIVALTALAMSGDRERCLAAGASDYLSKPVKMSQLLTLLQLMLSQQSGDLAADLN